MAAIRVEGLADLRRALNRVSAEAPKSLAAANHAVGVIVVDEAKRRAPKGPHQGGGNVIPIADSIRSANQAARAVVTIGGARSPHAVVEEFGGTIARRGFKGARGRARGNHVTRVSKRAYLYPAIDAKQAAIEDRYMTMLDEIVTRFEE